MVLLNCAIVGVGRVISIIIEEWKTVDLLKEVIKDESDGIITCPRPHLQLFLAKKKTDEGKGKGAWVVTNEVESRWSKTSDLKPLNAAAALNLYGLSETGVQLEVPLTEGDVDAGRVPVHVLVVVPGVITIKETDEVEYTTELQYYQRIGKEIQGKNKKYCEAILDKVDEYYAHSLPLPFICVEGSSGMGKSQLAFALGGEGRSKPRSWFYWPTSKIHANSQNVYKNFTSISDAFNDVVGMDKLEDISEADILNTMSSCYQTAKLWTYGFILELLKYSFRASHDAQMINIRNETFSVGKCDRSAIKALGSQMVNEGKNLPFFILDEMTPSTNDVERKKLAAFQRNVFRCCGLVVVIMGIDVKMTNLFSQSTHSRSEGRRWMTVVPHFPLYQAIPLSDSVMEDAWQKVIRLYPVVQEIAQHSRGMFSRCFVEAATKFALTEQSPVLADLLDEAFRAVSIKAQRVKYFMEHEHGKDAQLMTVSYTNAATGDGASADDGQPPRKKIRVGVKSMHLHFANLVDNQNTDVLLNQGNLYRFPKSGMWTPNCRFPTIEEDMLLYFAVLGGKDFSGYYDHNNQKAYSTVGMFKGCFGGESNQVVGNTNALCNDFSKFENMVAHALFCASRRNGVRGIAFDDFFSGLLGEFQDEMFQEKQMRMDERDIVASALLEKYEALQKKFSSTMIPFLAPPNAEWPKRLIDANIGDCKLGYIVHANSLMRLDLCVKNSHENDPLFVCECKYWKDDLDSESMATVIAGLNAEFTGPANNLERDWHDWNLALVFCKQLASFRKAVEFEGTGLVKVNCETCVAKWIIQPEEPRKKLVIVLEVGNLQSESFLLHEE